MVCKFPPCENEVRENPYKGANPLYCSKKCKNKQAVNELRKRRKEELVQLMGGKCQMCGFEGNSACFDFHHKIPEEKEFNISRNITLKLEKVKKELEKCELICANCHRTIHAHP